MELFTRKFTVIESNPDNDDTSEIIITVTNDRSDIVDGEYVALSYISPKTGKTVEEIYEQGYEPMDRDEFVEFVAKHEKIEECYLTIE